MENHFVLYCRKCNQDSIITRKYRTRTIMYNETAIKNKIDNMIDEYDNETFKNVKLVAEVLDNVYAHCVIKKICTWYVKEKLLTLTNDLPEHSTGYAVDFTTDDIEKDFDVLKEKLPFYTRLILETKDGKKYIHLEYNGNNERINLVL